MTDSLYSSIAVNGDDAFDFLQGQLTNDLRRLDEQPLILSAWCTPKGRVICVLRVRKTSEGFELTLPAELRDDVAERLAKFRFRARVEFRPQAADLVGLGVTGTLDEWLLDNLVAGIPEVWQPQSEAFTPHMLNLDLLDAVSLDKGCYTGQEIVARTHYRGASRRRLIRFVSSDPVAAGDPVYDGERKIGDVVNAIGTDLLAVVPTDKQDSPLFAAGATLLRQPLPYLQTDTKRR